VPRVSALTVRSLLDRSCSTGSRRRALALVGVAIWVSAACSWTGASRPSMPAAPHPDIGGPAVAAIKRAGVLRVGTDLSDPPLAFRERGAPAGYEMEVAQLLAQALGVRVRIVDTPRALAPSGFRGVDLLIGGWSADHAPGLPSRPYYVMRQALVWRSAGPKAGDAPLRGLRVAAQAESGGQRVAVRLGAAQTLLTLEPDEAVRAMDRGAVDVAVVDFPLAAHYGRMVRGLHVRQGAWEETPLVVVSRANAPDLAAFASAVIQDLEGSNGLAQLQRRWGL
jgi:glutamine transport system substrate-binding protein